MAEERITALFSVSDDVETCGLLQRDGLVDGAVLDLLERSWRQLASLELSSRDPLGAPDLRTRTFLSHSTNNCSSASVARAFQASEPSFFEEGDLTCLHSNVWDGIRFSSNRFGTATNASRRRFNGRASSKSSAEPAESRANTKVAWRSADGFDIRRGRRPTSRPSAIGSVCEMQSSTGGSNGEARSRGRPRARRSNSR